MAKAAPRIPVRKTYKLYIGGKFPRSESGRYLTVEGPKGDFVANVSRGSRKDFRMAMVAARKALGGWSGRSAFNRGQILYRMAEMLESRGPSFASRLVETCGYTQAEANAEVDAATDRLVYYAGWTDKFSQVFGGTNPVASPHFNISMIEPTGVVAIRCGTHAPLIGLISAFAPVIAAGNTAIAVVDPRSALVAIDLAEVLATSDLPGGVVNVISGLHDELAPHLSGHMDVDALLAFGATAEQERELALAAADTVKRARFLPDYDRADWLAPARQSPYWILPFIEVKTAWHPMGV